MNTDVLPLPDLALLPDDPAVLKQLVVQLLAELQKERGARERLEHHLHLLLKRIYGSTSEKFDPRQAVLFDPQSGAEENALSRPASPPASSPVSRKRDKHGRGRIPDKIKREEVTHDLSEQNVAVARKPAEAIPGALAGPGLMAQVIVCKGTDHLPLNRQEGIFKRQGLRLSRQTMDGWWLQTAEFLRPLYDLAIRVVLASHVIHTDDTSVRVRDAQKKLKYTGRFWPYVGDQLHSLVVFDYTPNHQRAGPAAFLKDYRGYLQADAFNGYDGIYLESRGRIIEVACWAHARRKFHECRRLDAARMETALAWIGKFYAVEKDLRERCGGQWQNLAFDERANRIAVERQERSCPLLNDFHAWLDAEAPKVLPKSEVRGAMDYVLNNWAALCVYTEDGWLDIDNNEGENSIRGLCLGRKNWLFLGNDRGGRAAAIHFSLLSSCKRHGHDPWAYYRDVLIRLPTILPSASDEELLPLLPHLWKPA